MLGHYCIVKGLYMIKWINDDKEEFMEVNEKLNNVELIGNEKVDDMDRL